MTDTLLPLKLQALRHATAQTATTRALPHILHFAAGWRPQPLTTAALTLVLVAAAVPALEVAVRHLRRGPGHAPVTVALALWRLPLALLAAVAVAPWSGKLFAVLSAAAGAAAVWDASSQRQHALRRL